jgi:RNA polymerase sigma-70 factor, ECF subfamily
MATSPATHEGMETFAAVYDTHFDHVWRSLARLGVAAESVEDAVQDLFVVVHRRLPEFEGRSSIKTWLFGIALRVAADYRRRVQRKGGLAPLPSDVAGHGQSPLEAAVQAQATEVLYALLDELGDDERAIFVLVELDELTVVDAATALAVNPNTASARLRAARQTFNKAVARYQARVRRENHG